MPEAAHADACIYIHDPMSLPARKRLVRHISGYSYYVERALVLAGPGDVVCTFESVSDDYLAWLTDLGLSPGKPRVISPSAPATDCETVAGRLCQSPADIARIAGCIRSAERCLMSPFYLGPDDVRLAEMLQDAAGVEIMLAGGSPSLSAHFALKTAARAEAERLGIPLPESRTVCVDRDAEGNLGDVHGLVSAIRDAVDNCGGAFVHGNEGVAGSANFLFGSDHAHTAAVRKALEKDRNTTYLVDHLLPADVSPNVLVDVPFDAAPPARIGTSDQILTSNFVHQGNVAPSRARRLEDMVRDALRLAAWLQHEGYAGPAGFDFIEWGPESARRYALCELNPRVNGASYPLGLLNRFREAGCGACLSRNLKSDAAGFSELRAELSPFLLQPGECRGLLPYNTGCLPFGKFTGAFLAESTEDAEDMLAQFLRDTHAN